MKLDTFDPRRHGESIPKRHIVNPPLGIRGLLPAGTVIPEFAKQISGTSIRLTW